MSRSSEGCFESRQPAVGPGAVPGVLYLALERPGQLDSQHLRESVRQGRRPGVHSGLAGSCLKRTSEQARGDERGLRRDRGLGQTFQNKALPAYAWRADVTAPTSRKPEAWSTEARSREARTTPGWTPLLSQGRGFGAIFQQVLLRRDKHPKSLRFTASTEPQSSEASIRQSHPQCQGPPSSRSHP